MKPTGWNNGLSQDYNKELGSWFADRPGAREQLRRDYGLAAADEIDALTDDELLAALLEICSHYDTPEPTLWQRIKQFWRNLW